MPNAQWQASGQHWLIDYMQHLGYTADRKGVCFGVAHMAMQAMLTKDLASFDNRLYKIYKDPHRTLSKSAQYQSGIRALFDGIELYQQPKLYKYLFEKHQAPHGQNAIRTAPLLLSHQLEKLGGINKSGDFSGVYNKKELTQFFQSFKTAVHETYPNFNDPIAIMLVDSGHSICVGYEPVKQQWIMIDANQLPTQYFTQDKQIAKEVLNAFGKHTSSELIAAQPIVSQDNIEALKNIVSHWHEYHDWKEIHKISHEKALFKNDNGENWFEFASQHHDDANARALARHPLVDPNKADQWGQTPLESAIYSNNVALAQALLEHPRIDPNKANQKGETPLELAKDYHNQEILNALLNHPHINANRFQGTQPQTEPEYEEYEYEEQEYNAQRLHIDDIISNTTIPNISESQDVTFHYNDIFNQTVPLATQPEGYHTIAIQPLPTIIIAPILDAE